MVTGIFCFMEARFQNWADIAGCDACRVLSSLRDCTCRADKAFTPHPPVARCNCRMRRLTRLIRPTPATHPAGLIRCASIASGIVLQPPDPAYRLMQYRHRVFQSAGAVFYHRRHLRTLFHQLGIFLGDEVKLIHCTGQAGKPIGLFQR